MFNNISLSSLWTISTESVFKHSKDGQPFFPPSVKHNLSLAFGVQGNVF
jgi:hypothetical protein